MCQATVGLRTKWLLGNGALGELPVLTSFLSSLKHDPERWRLSDLSSRQKLGSTAASSSWPHSSPTFPSSVRLSQESDNQITQDDESHITSMDPVFVFRSVIQSTEKRKRSVSGKEKNKPRRDQSILSPAIFFYISLYLPYTHSFHIFFFFCSCDRLPSCGMGLLMNAEEHVGNVWVSIAALSLSDRSSTRLWRLA